MRRALIVFLLLYSTCICTVSAQKTLKRKVAVGRFSNTTNQSQSIFYDSENDPLGKQAADILSTKLASSEKFILIERQDFSKIIEELDKTNRVSQTIGADFLIIGSVTEFGRKNVGTQKVFSNSVTQIVEAGVSIRLVDVSTGLIIYSEEAKGVAEVQDKRVMGMGSTADFDATLSDKAIGAAIGKLVENIINKCMDKPWKAYLLAEDDGNFIISGGKTQGISVGDKFAIYSVGKKVNNPQTGVTVTLPGKKVATIVINQTLGNTPQEEISMATIVDGEIDTNNLLKYTVVEFKVE